ncbi:MAG: transglutaminase domain-containing protein [Thermoanaerobaculaceae bacterium]|nr:transglutaminase domain-containing protein [Thermoanaerobaculaceae bacterium]MDI9622685.1 transglutaminase domain-containing protein [Acidobacteriota bacterium]
MSSTARVWSLAVAGTLVLALRVGAGTPDWVDVRADTPTPTGAYIATNDDWVVVWGEIEIGLEPGNRIRARHRLLLENLATRAATYTLVVAHDPGRQALEEVALYARRSLGWSKVDIERKGSEATIEGSGRVVLVSAELVPPRKRVAVEFTLRDRLGMTPWLSLFVPRREPIARLQIRLAPGAAGQGLRLDLRVPSGDPAPPGFEQDPEGTWTVTAVPAASRISAGRLRYQPASDGLFPWFLARVASSPGDRLVDFAPAYRKAWDERASAIDQEPVVQQAAALAGAAVTPREKARAVFEFVQRQVVYDDSNSTSIEAWLPLPTQETLRSRKADCKGKVMLLQALLRAAGIESVPVLVRSDDHHYAWDGKVGAAFINHVVLAARLPADDGPLPATLRSGPLAGWVLLDPTATTTAFGEVTPWLAHAPALAVADAADPVFVVETAVASGGWCRVRVDTTLAADGGARLTAELEDTGLGPLAFRFNQPVGAQDGTRLLAAILGERSCPSHVAAWRSRLPGEDGVRGVSVTLEASQPGCLQRLASSAVLPSPLGVAAALAGLPRTLVTESPPKPEDAVELIAPWNPRRNASGMAERYDLVGSVALPAGLAWTPPPVRRGEQPWGTWSVAWERLADGRFEGRLELAVRRGEWPAEGRKARLAAVDELLTAVSSPLLLQGTSP